MRSALHEDQLRSRVWRFATRRVAPTALASLVLASCVSAGVSAGPSVMTHTSGVVAPGGQARACLGLSSPPSWAYCNPVTFTVGSDLASGRTLLSVMGGAEVHTHPTPWGVRVGLHGGILQWADSKEQNYNVALTGSLLRAIWDEQGGSESVTWSTSVSFDLLVAGTWGDTLSPGLMVGLGVSLALDWMKGYRFNLNFH